MGKKILIPRVFILASSLILSLALFLSFFSPLIHDSEVAFLPESVQLKAVQHGGFLFQNLFVQQDLMTAGVIEIPKDGLKPSRNSSNRVMVYHIIRGLVEVTLHRTTFALGTGAHFFIPPSKYECMMGDDEGWQDGLCMIPCSPSCAVGHPLT